MQKVWPGHKEGARTAGIHLLTRPRSSLSSGRTAKTSHLPPRERLSAALVHGTSVEQPASPGVHLMVESHSEQVSPRSHQVLQHSGQVGPVPKTSPSRWSSAEGRGETARNRQAGRRGAGWRCERVSRGCTWTRTSCGCGVGANRRLLPASTCATGFKRCGEPLDRVYAFCGEFSRYVSDFPRVLSSLTRMTAA